MSIGTEEMEVELMQEAMQGSAGFSLWHSKNFARIAKVTMHSKNLNFRYALYFHYDSEISLSYRNWLPSDFDPNDLVLCNSHFVPNVIIYFLYFWYFTLLVWLYKPQFVTLK